MAADKRVAPDLADVLTDLKRVLGRHRLLAIKAYVMFPIDGSTNFIAELDTGNTQADCDIVKIEARRRCALPVLP